MGGSKTVTYKDLQVQKLMDDPEKAYKAAMKQAYKNVGAGMRSVIREYQQGIIDTRSMFNDSYLTNLGYNPKETIPYSIVDPILVRSWLLSNIDSSIGNVVSYKWAIPSLEEIALEYLQDTYSGMSLADKSFLIGSIRWYVSGVTNVSTTMTNATCYKDRLVTAEEYAVSVGLVVASVEDIRYTIAGVNYWKVKMTDESVVDVPVEYITIECPGVGSDVVQAIISKYNGKEYPVHDSGNNPPLWSNVVRVSVYIESDGGVKVTGTALRPVYSRFNASRYLEATKEAVANIVDQVEKEIATDLIEELDRLVVVYTLNGIQKLKLAEINKSLVSSTAKASAYPIIPLRENYAFVKETNQMKAMLNKIGMATDDFESSLGNDKIKNAAVMFLLDLRDSSAVGTKVVYETLVNMVKTTIPAAGKTGSSEEYQLDLRFSDVNMKSSVKFKLKTVSGTVGSVGKYVRYSRTGMYTKNVSGIKQYLQTMTGTVYGIRKQVTESYYEEMEFDTCKTIWKVGGYELSGELSLKDTNGKIYIPVTDLGLNGLSYEELHYAVARSLNMMALSIVKVKVKWYQTGFFKILMYVVAVAVFAFTGNPMMLLMMVAGDLGLFKGSFGKALQIVLIVAGGYQGVTASGATAAQQGLAVASTLTSLAQIAVEINTEGTVKAVEKKRAAKQAEMKASEEQIKEIEKNTHQGLWVGIQDRTPDMLYALSSTDMMCNYGILYDYDGLIDGQIESVGI